MGKKKEVEKKLFSFANFCAILRRAIQNLPGRHFSNVFYVALFWNFSPGWRRACPIARLMCRSLQNEENLKIGKQTFKNAMLYCYILLYKRKYLCTWYIFKIYIKIQLYLDFYKYSTDWQWNRKFEKYMHLYQLKKIKRVKSRLKGSIKLLLSKSEKIPCTSKRKKC